MDSLKKRGIRKWEEHPGIYESNIQRKLGTIMTLMKLGGGEFCLDK
jgi:hypothetical protein